MDARYRNPEVDQLWSPHWTYYAWYQVEREVTRSQYSRDLLPSKKGAVLLRNLDQHGVTADDVTWIQGEEQKTKHDVVAFTNWARSWLPGHVSGLFHYGLTSSDLVDTAQGLRFQALRKPLASGLADLLSEVSRWALDDTVTLGRTHGQVAEPVTVRQRSLAWAYDLAEASRRLVQATNRVATAKVSGPTGVYSHTPVQVETDVAAFFGLKAHGPGATQVASRAPFAAWAQAASALVDVLAKVAHDLRLLNLLGEVVVSNAPGQVGSSSLAHKVNPIRLEQLGGLQALAQGYALALHQRPLWLERDLSNSSVERVAVPDLWHVLLQAVGQLTAGLQGAQVDAWRVTENFEKERHSVTVFERTCAYLLEGDDWETARNKALTGEKESDGS